MVIETDSLEYIRSLAGANIGIRITNKTDSTVELPICKALEKRIDVKKANAWALGIPDWSVPCQEVIVEEGFLEKNATYGESIRIDMPGTFRVVTIYGYRRGNYTDTLFSNEFSVL